MNNKVNLSGLEVPDREREGYHFEVFGEERDPLADDAAFYCQGEGSTMVAAVVMSDRTIAIRCDGMMRIENVKTGDVYRCASDLINAGFRTNEGLWEAERTGEIVWHNNPWFDLYEDESGESLSLIAGTYSEAIEFAYDTMFDSARA